MAIKLVTGIGYDIHPFAEGRPLVLGGVEIAHHCGLEGHSDADVLLHAIADAILGALGLPDIGHYFPPGKPATKDLVSIEILEKCKLLIDESEGVLNNIDSTLIAEEPKIISYRGEMKETIAKALGIEPRWVGIKATTNEKMGAIGRAEGIAALATCSINIRT